MKKNKPFGELFNRSLKKTLLIMRIAVILMMLGILQAQANDAYAQKTRLSLNFSETELVKVLDKIEDESEFFFLYNEKLLDTERKVSITANDQLINVILDNLFAGTDVKYTIIDRKIILAPEYLTEVSQPQQVKISGTVTDVSTGEALPGVNVVVRGSTIGTITDVNGSYTLEVPNASAALQFSFIGYVLQEIALGGRTTLNVALTSNVTQLSEVVVVGYGTKKLSELSSSVSVVSEQALEKGTISQNLGTMLQGKVPGLVVSNSSGHPQSSPNVVLRGVGSMGAGYKPLYVVDGIIGGSADPADIASVTVLKDAAATGLFGSRAANGVILITTKSGKSGKTKVTYSAVGGFTSFRNGNLEMMNSAELYENRKEAGRNYYDDKVASGDPAFTGISFDQYFETIVPSSVLNTDTNWPALLTRSGYINKHNLSVSGGNEKTTFYVSGNYYYELGTLVGEDFQNIALRANFKHQISDRLTLSWNANGGTNEYPNDPQSGQEGVMVQWSSNMPFDPAYEADGITPYNPNTSGYWYGNAKANYFYDRDHYSDRTKNLDLNTDIRLDVKITDWMSFSTSNRVGFSGSDWKQMLDNKYWLTKFDNGRLSQNYSYTNSFLTSNLLKMDHSFGDHYLSFILGHEYSHSKYSNTNAVGINLPLGLNALNSTASAKSVSGNVSENGFLSYFGQADYNYLNRYYLVGSLRRDASSLFGANNKWGSFYSIGGSWIVNKENFLNDVSWIDILKVKLSYGTTGNANISPYLSMGTYSFTLSTTYNGNSGATPARLQNLDLTWETAYTTNLGLEFAIQKRVTLELDFYNRINKNLLQSVNLPVTTGFINQQRNVGSVRNRGVDVNLNTVNIKGEFRWETNLNLNINRNKVLALNKGEDIQSGNMRIREGLPLRYFYMKEWAGVDVQTGDPLWVRWEDENGNTINGAANIKPTKILTTNDYNSASNLFITSPYPDFTGGITNDFHYKNFSLSVLCNFVVGQMIYLQNRDQIDDDGNVLSKNQMKLYKDWVRWEKPGDVATHPRLLLGGNKNSSEFSSRYMEDGSYLSIQNMTFSYTFPRIFSGLRLYTMIDNLTILTKFSGSSPDIDIENPTTSESYGSTNFGASRKVIFGINVDF